MAKHARTEIIVTARYKIVNVDALNWQVYEYKTLKKSNNPNLKSREGEKDWVALQTYFGRPEFAADWIARKQFADGGEIYDTIQAAVKDFEKVSKMVVRNVAKALENAKS